MSVSLGARRSCWARRFGESLDHNDHIDRIYWNTVDKETEERVSWALIRPHTHSHIVHRSTSRLSSSRMIVMESVQRHTSILEPERLSSSTYIVSMSVWVVPNDREVILWQRSRTHSLGSASCPRGTWSGRSWDTAWYRRHGPAVRRSFP